MNEMFIMNLLHTYSGTLQCPSSVTEINQIIHNSKYIFGGYEYEQISNKSHLLFFALSRKHDYFFRITPFMPDIELRLGLSYEGTEMQFTFSIQEETKVLVIIFEVFSIFAGALFFVLQMLLHSVIFLAIALLLPNVASFCFKTAANNMFYDMAEIFNPSSISALK